MKIPEAIARKFNNVWICRRCKSKARADNLRIMKKEIVCKRCGQRCFRPKSKEKRAVSK